jgi:soluble lytic murein transglycosylase-like protein
MMTLWFLLMFAAVTPSETTAAVGFADMARADEWESIHRVAVRRVDQLPLRPDEALIAAEAARKMADGEAEEHFLVRALESPDLGAVAKVELAELVVDDRPDAALDLVVDFLRSAPTAQLRYAAVDVAVAAIAGGIGPDQRSLLEKRLPTLRRSSRRSIELALALSSEPVDRERLGRILASSTDDLAALTAANELSSTGELGDLDQWRVAQTFYRHALYDRAAPILEGLDDVENRQIPRREVAYLRGRCAFRRGRWDEATEWYKKAISRTTAGERRAQLEVHLARTFELADDMDEAVAAAQRAVRLKTTDDRRLFLARLRLRRDEPDLARAGLSRVRSRSARARGDLILGYYELASGDREDARRILAGVARDPWRGPATVLSAELALEEGDPNGALLQLEKRTTALDAYWAHRARQLTAALPDEIMDAWRGREASAIAGPDPRARHRALARVLTLEPETARVMAHRELVAVVFELDGGSAPPDFVAGLASRLWDLGLPSSALRWDPGGFPKDQARSTWWTAEQELANGWPWRAIRDADAARRQATSLVPDRGLPSGLRLALYPLPEAPMVKRAAKKHGVPWQLLAGVAREESRWNPEVVSKVGARGLMQLMPATAAATGAANGHPEVSPDDLFSPAISLDLGAAELGRLLDVFDGNRAAAVAAYNAGEAQAQLWLDQCGEECSEHRFVSLVSFSVTRSYVEDVLAAAVAYDELYPDKGPVTR